MICKKMVKWYRKIALFYHQWRFQDSLRLVFSRPLRALSKSRHTVQIQDLISWNHCRLHQRYRLLTHRSYLWAKVGMSLKL
jgi:hypothetical protein